MSIKYINTCEMLRPVPCTYLALNYWLLVLFLPGMEQGVAGNFVKNLLRKCSVEFMVNHG